MEDLITEGRAKRLGRVLTEAERDAVLWVGDREEGTPIEWIDRPSRPVDPQLCVQ